MKILGLSVNDVKIKTVYKSDPDRQPGFRRMSNSYGMYTIIGKVDDHTGRYYVVKFDNTGSEIVVSGSAFNVGTVRDPTAPTFFGKGYEGVGPYRLGEKYKSTKWGQLWINMLMRCYSEKYLEKTPTYRGCEVCERWLNFQVFCEDIKSLPGYSEWLERDNYALDKDILIPGNKIYRPEACQFVYEGTNTIASNKSKSVYEGRDTNDNIYYFRNQRTFAESHGMTKGGISSVVRGDQVTHRGWIFRKLTKEEIEKINPELIQD